MRPADHAVEQAADRLEGVAETAAERGGLAERAAPALEEDADFLRKLAPSKIKRRWREGDPGTSRTGAREPRPAREHGGLAALGAAFALGAVVAKLVEWRSYAE